MLPRGVRLAKPVIFRMASFWAVMLPGPSSGTSVIIKLSMTKWLQP